MSQRYRLRIVRPAARALTEALPEKVAAVAYEFISGPLLMTVDRYVLGQRVAYWRVQRRLTQQELADRLGRPRNWVWKVESGTIGSLERCRTLAQVADALTVDMQVLLGRELSRLPDSTACVDPRPSR